MRASASQRLVRLGDVIGTIALVASLRSPDIPTRSTRASGPPPVGRVLWQLALAEETFFASHNRYAPHASVLDLALPSGWKATVLTGSTRRYQVRLEVGVGPERGVSCLLWGNRVLGQVLDEFQVNCGRVENGE